MTATETPSALRLLEVDPRLLQVNPANVRKKAKGLDELAKSIAAIGVQVPLIVKQNGTGDTWVIVAGERRALAAVKADVATVPVIIREYHDGGQAELTAMMVENLHRDDLTPAEEAKGYEQLAAFGVSIDEIAELTGRDTARVSHGLKVATSKAADGIAGKHDLTLEQLAAIAEVEDSKPDVDRLVRCASNDPARFEHELARVREQRKQRERRQASINLLKSAGVRIVKAAPGYNFGTGVVRLDYLVDDAGKQITAAAHKKCPGHCAHVSDSLYSDPKPTYCCSNPEKNGHKPRHPHSRNSSSKPTAADKAKAAEAQRKLDEDEKLLELSSGVRCKFVRDLLARKTPPKGTLAFVVPVILEHEIWSNVETVEELTTAKATDKRPSAEKLLASLAVGASDARLQVVLLAHIACALESGWQPYLLAPASYQSNIAEAQYLQFLQSCGYGLSDVEQRIITAAFPPAKASRAKKKA